MIALRLAQSAALAALTVFFGACSSKDGNLNPAPPPPVGQSSALAIDGEWECVESWPLDGQFTQEPFLVGEVIEIDWVPVVDPETGLKVVALKLEKNLTTGEEYLEHRFMVRIEGCVPKYLEPDWCFNSVDVFDGVVDFCYSYDWLERGPAAHAPCYVRYGLRLSQQGEALVGYETFVTQHRVFTPRVGGTYALRFERGHD